MNPKHHKPRCPSDQNPLKTRICNQGFVLETLPNVQRPGPSFPGLNPLSVRISSKNQSLIPIIYQYQPSILHKTSSSFYSKKKPNKTPIEDDKKVSSYKIPFLPPLERLNNSSMSGFFNTKQAEFFDSLKKQGSGFELEARHTRFLVEKLSGKLNLDKRYKPAFSIEKAPLVTKTSVIEKLPLLDPSLKRPFSKVDKYIELIMKNVTNLDEFIYLYQESSVEDPYELEVIDYERVKEQGLKEYFTISRQGLCLYENGKPSDFVPLAIWLKERETYDRIKSLRFFSKFRKWKTLRMWKRNLVNSKRKQNRDALEASLFILIPRFRESLLLHKSCCIEIEKLTFMGLSQPQSYTTEIPNLEEFQSQQARKRGIISQKLKELSSECREQVRNCFQDRLELLRNGEDVTKKDPYEEQLKKTQEKGFKSKDTAYENIGFVEELSYEKRSQLRKECSLFLRFAYLVDFLTLDSLKNVYNNSLVELLSDMGSLLNVKESISFSERVNKPISKLKDPLFHLSINAVFSKQIPEAFIKTQIIPNYLPPPLGSSKLEDFSLLCHICIKEESRIKPKIEEEGPEEEEDSDLYYDDEKTFTREICPNLYKIWLEIQPNQEEFLQGILLAIKEGGDSLQVFERWSRHEEMTPFVNILEEWDDMLGEEWELPESCYLNPSDVLSPLELESYLLQLKEILNKAFQRVETYLAGFNEFLMLYWENSRFDPLVFKNSRIIREAETIKETLLLINYQKEVLEEKVPSQADLGLFRIDSTELRDLLLPSPQVLWKKLQVILPEELRFRARVLKDWMLGSSLTMKAGIGSLEDFVKQRNSVQEIENEYTGVKRKLEELNQMAIILKDAGFELKKEEEGLLIDTNQLSVRLSIGLASVLEALAKGMESNALKISRQLIPELIKFVNELDYKVKESKFIRKEIPPDLAILELERLQEEFLILETLGRRYQDFQKVLNLERADFEDLRNLKEEIGFRLFIWKGLKDWSHNIEEWQNGLFNDIQPDLIMNKAEFYISSLRNAQKRLPPSPVLDELKNSVFDFKDAMPVIVALRNPFLKDCHWKELIDLVPELKDLESLTLKELIGLNIGKKVLEVQEIATQASQEAILEREYDLIHGKWLALEFSIQPYKSDKTKELYLLTEIDELFVSLDELLALLNNILGSRYLKNLRNKAEDLHKKLLYTQETIDDWIICQKNWIYLENIFEAQDIKKKLQNESSQFEIIDKAFRLQMRKTFQFRVLNKSLTPEIGKTFKKHKETLNQIQKALENYLELKRVNFPRFYFLSNEELLDILANSLNLPAIQKHMKKCFENIFRLNTGEDPKSSSIIGMISSEGEKVDFNKQVSIRSGDIEHWLNLVQDQMRESLSRLMKIGRNDLELKERKKWVLDHVAQVIATVSQTSWCAMTEYFFDQMSENSNSLGEWFQMNFLQLTHLTELVRENLDSVKRRVVVALITQDVHARDIVETLLTENTGSKNEFQWQQQLRYYWDESLEKENVFVLQINAKLKYGYEYMGATTRLVITPLTDRCWITITGALNIKLGASPSGPAGTGKTESIKDLAKALGVFCVVFNCSEQIEHKMMARLFSGLAQQGAWACLDEFNRIDIEVLSVIAQQLLLIRQACLKGEKKFFFLNDIIQLKEGFGVFITMNPGYAGRTELPDNLKVLFRPVSMMIPDYRLIAEIILFSEGFENSKILSNKMVQLYKLSSEQLSQQKHYDFGMRAVKSVLVMAGALKRSDPVTNEDGVLIKAMRDSNLPKFLKHDIPLFLALIQDLFPDAILPKDDNKTLEKALEKASLDIGLQVCNKQVNKAIQLFETFNVRFGVMLVGSTGSGKTRCFQVLQKALTDLRKTDNQDERFQTVHDYIINPKSLGLGELYGEVNPFTEEWQDGLAAKLLREAATDEAIDRKKDYHWIIFDGPVDSLWIENLNTVLDDNMMLCLANGQRIKLRSEMRVLFEVSDLQAASPATVSRCGMVYLTPEELGWKPYVLSWLDLLVEKTFRNEDSEQVLEGDQEELLQFINKEFKQILLQLFEEHVGETLKYLRNSNFKEPIISTDLQLVFGLCNLLECFLCKSFGFRVFDKPYSKKRFLLHAFAFAIIWSLLATIPEESYMKMDDFIRKRFGTLSFPINDYVYGFFLNTINLEFKPWSDKVQEFVFQKEAPYFELLVQTNDTVRFSFLVEWLLKLGKRPFITGGTGVGKSLIIKSLLGRLHEKEGLDSIFLMLSAATSSSVIQSTIETRLEKYKKTLYGAKPGRKAVIFIDDVNMPAIEAFGAQPPIELLRLLIDRGGLYDRKEKFWKEVQNTTFLAIAAPPTGGRNNLTPRFTRHFNLLCMPQPSNKTLFRIFHSILIGFLSTNGFMDFTKRLSDQIVLSTIEVFFRLLKEKKAVPSKFFYTYNLRDLSKVFQGILMVQPHALREKDQFLRLWVHETSRVFYDRLVDNDDRVWFNTLIIELLNKDLAVKWSYEDLFEQDNQILFGDLLRLESGKEYEEIKEPKKLLKVFSEKMDDYNSDAKNKTKLNLVFFKDAIAHILRNSRVLRQPRGNLMLIGVGGSGKQSLTRLSAFLTGLTVQQVELTKGFNESGFREILRELLKSTGLDGEKIVFLFTDTQAQDSFLEDLNNLLNSGEVPDLWETIEDKEKIIKTMREVLKRDDTPDLLYSAFVERVRNNLHIVLCVSPVGASLRARCRKFPALVDCCTLDWFAAWPDEALISVSRALLEEIPLESLEVREGLILMCREVHISAIEQARSFEETLRRKVYITPKSFLDFLELFGRLLEEKKKDLSYNMERLGNGIDKLEAAESLVAQLQKDLTLLQPQLKVQSLEMNKALVLLEKDSAKALEQELLVSKEREEINKQTQEIKQLTEEAQAEVEIVRPELEAAENAIKNIDEKQIATMRTYASPPQIVEDVMAGVCILFSKKYEWLIAKSLMLNLNAFIASLLNYPKDNIKEDVLIKLRKHRNSPNVCFKPEEIKNRAPAAADLCTWCIAMDTYASVSRKVAPKKAKVAGLQEKLNASNKILLEKETQVFRVKANLQKLKTKSDLLLQQKTQTEILIKQTIARLDNAGILTGLLKEEGKRWAISIKDYEAENLTIVGDTFLSTAMLNYCSAFTGTFRQSLLSKWVIEMYKHNIALSSDEPSIIKILGKPIEIRQWTLEGLPSDTVSLENAIFAKKSLKYPLFIDPQMQAKKWLQKALNLRLMNFSDVHFQSNMKAALSQGLLVLIQDTEDYLDPVLDPILSKNIYKSNEGRVSIRFSEQDVDFNEGFNLFLTTKLPNPDYLPEIFIKTCVINFTVTFDGLEEQLLAATVKLEQPQLEQTRDENILKLSVFRKKILDSENLILKLLSESQNDTLLDDLALIKTLQTSKAAALEIDRQIKSSIILENSIEKARNQYKEVSIRGSVLYFVVKDLALLDPMYQYSLQYITRLFLNAIQGTSSSDSLTERVKALLSSITKQVFTNVCRGLFEVHKLLFSFIIASSIEKQANIFTNDLWELFLRGLPQISTDNKSSVRSIDPSITPRNCELLFHLQLNYPHFKSIIAEIPLKLYSFNQYIISLEKNGPKFNSPWETTLAPFEQLLLLSLIKPEKLCFGIAYYIRSILGDFFLESPEISIQKLFSDSDSRTPVIFILSQGADPTESLLSFAKEKEREESLFLISLGQGQGPFAARLIEEGKKAGSWVFLQNCHLARTWMSGLELILEDLANCTELNEDFRLFLTSMPTKDFPVSILQNGIKLTTEPPRGVKATLRRTFAEVGEEFLEGCEKGAKVLHKLFWGLACFHSLLLERRKFGALGWNIHYEFNDSDLSTSKTVLLMLLNEQEQTPWEALLFVTGHINYGGRVTDDWDRRCLLSLLKKFYNTEALEEGYHFSETDFQLPSLTTLNNYKKFIESLPNNDDPELFGLHPNANISFQAQESQKVLETLLFLEPRVLSGGAKSPDETVLSLLEAVKEGLPNLLTKEEGLKDLFLVNEQGLLPSLSTVLLQELERFGVLILRIRSSIQALQSAIQGLGLMSEELDSMYFGLLRNQVPKVWEEVGYPSLKHLGAWLLDLKERLLFMNEWLYKGNPNCFWLSGLFFPQGFLTGVLQTHARKYKVPIDQIQFGFRVMEEKESIFGKPLDGVYIYGLWLVGASWDRKKKTLTNQTIGETYCKMPVVHFNSMENYEVKATDYTCPVYKTSLRRGILSTTGQSTNYILAVDLPSPDDYVDYWTLRGTALLSQLDD